MEYKCKDLTEYGHNINKAADIQEAKLIFIEMVESFDFKSKKALYISQAKQFNKSKLQFTTWAWNIILSSGGLKVIK